jgi:hypothetical protein
VAVTLVGLGYWAVVHHFTSEEPPGCPDYERTEAGTPPPQPAPKGSAQRTARKKALRRLLRRLKTKRAEPPSLVASGPTRAINVTGTDGIARTDVLLAASPALPRGLKRTTITVDVPEDFRRVDEKSSTQYLPGPFTSEPRIIEGRKVVSFDLCIPLSADSVAAGTYAGQIITTAPGYQPGTVAIPVNVKDSDWFVKVFIGAIIIAFLLLLFQAALAEWNAQGEGGKRQEVGKAFKKPIKDVFGFWAATAIAIAAVFGATWGVYAANPGWGADHFASGVGLVGTAIAAAGLGNLVGGIKAKATQDGATGETAPEGPGPEGPSGPSPEGPVSQASDPKKPDPRKSRSRKPGR